jgi:hypothetical protein
MNVQQDDGPGRMMIAGGWVRVCPLVDDTRQLTFGDTSYLLTRRCTYDLTEWECTTGSDPGTLLLNVNKFDSEPMWTAVRRSDGEVQTYDDPIVAVVTMIIGVRGKH